MGIFWGDVGSAGELASAFRESREAAGTERTAGSSWHPHSKNAPKMKNKRRFMARSGGRSRSV
jgi:hypothetical protein